MNAHDIFISYKAEDYKAASRVRSELERNGLSCWMAPESIAGGSSYAKEIPQAIRQCRVLTVVLSRKTMSSIWVPKELDQALNQGKKIMPFMLEDFQLEGDFDFYLTAVQWYPAYQNMDKALGDMIRDIRKEIGSVAVQPMEPVTRRSLPSRLRRILIPVLLALLVLGSAFFVYDRFIKHKPAVYTGYGETRPAGDMPVIDVVPPQFSEDEESGIKNEPFIPGSASPGE